MESSFHLLAIYAAARIAGFDRRTARLISYASEGVDWSIYGLDDGSANKARTDTLGKDRIAQTGTQMTKLTREGTPTWLLLGPPSAGKQWQRGEGTLSWMAFHFLPCMDHGGKFALNMTELREYKETQNRSEEKQRKFERNVKLYNAYRIDRNNLTKQRNGGKYTYKVGLICRPGSRSSKAMMADTKDIIKTEVDNVKKGGRWGEKVGSLRLNGQQGIADGGTIKDYLRRRHFDINVRDFLIMLIGVRLHVFADTWAHQGFAAPRGGGLNDLERFIYEWQGRDHVDKCNALGGFWARAPRAMTYMGHGRAGHFPDYPSFRYKYTRYRDGKEIIRDNPMEYSTAMLEIVKFLKGVPGIIKHSAVAGTGRGWRRGLPNIFHVDFWDKPNEQKWETKKWANEWLTKVITKAEPYTGVSDWNFITKTDGGKETLERLGTRHRTLFSLAAAYHRHWLTEEIRKVYNKDLSGYLAQALG